MRNRLAFLPLEERIVLDASTLMFTPVNITGVEGDPGSVTPDTFQFHDNGPDLLDTTIVQPIRLEWTVNGQAQSITMNPNEVLTFPNDPSDPDHPADGHITLTSSALTQLTSAETMSNLTLFIGDSDALATEYPVGTIDINSAAPPEIVPFDVPNGVVSSEILFSAMYHDTNPGKPDSAFINWGDGSTTPGVIDVADPVQPIVTATHTYDAPGDYLVTLTVTDGDNGASATLTDLTHIDAVQAAKLWGLGAQGNLFSIGDFTNPVSTTTDYGQLVYQMTTGETSPLGQVRSFAVEPDPDHDSGMAYLVVDHALLNTTLSGNDGNDPIILSINLNDFINGKADANVARIVGFLDTGAVGDHPITALAFSPTGELYGLIRGGATSPEQLVTIDIANVPGNQMINFTPVGSVSNTSGLSIIDSNGEAMKFDHNGNLFISDSYKDVLYQVDPSTGNILGVVNNERNVANKNVDITALAWDATTMTLIDFNNQNNSLGSLATTPGGTNSTFITMAQRTTLGSILNHVVGSDFF